MARVNPLLLALIAYLSYSIKDVLERDALTQISFASVQVLLYGITAVALLAYGLHKGSLKDLWPRQPKVALISSATLLLSETAFLLSLSKLPLANLFVIVMLTPFLVLAFAWWFLREKLTGQQLAAMMVAFGGALLMVASNIEISNTTAVAGYIFIIIATLLNAIRTVFLRAKADGERATSLVAFNSVLGVLIYAPFGLVPLFSASLQPMAESMTAGLLDMTAMVLLVLALQRTKAASVQAMQYSQMIWAIIAGYLLWSEVPGPATMIGSVVVIAAGIYMLRQQRTVAVATENL